MVKVYNPFKAHLVQDREGYFLIRKLSVRLTWEFLELGKVTEASWLNSSWAFHSFCKHRELESALNQLQKYRNYKAKPKHEYIHVPNQD